MANDSTVRLFVLYDGADADAGMVRTATIADETSNKIGASGTKAGVKFGDEMEKGTSRAGAAFTSSAVPCRTGASPSRARKAPPPSLLRVRARATSRQVRSVFPAPYASKPPLCDRRLADNGDTANVRCQAVRIPRHEVPHVRFVRFGARDRCFPPNGSLHHFQTKQPDVDVQGTVHHIHVENVRRRSWLNEKHARVTTPGMLSRTLVQQRTPEPPAGGAIKRAAVYRCELGIYPSHVAIARRLAIGSFK